MRPPVQAVAAAVLGLVLLSGALAPQAVASAPGSNGLIFFGTGTGNGDVYSVRPDGSGLTNVTNHPGGDPAGAPRVRPDGAKVFFMRGAPGSGDPALRGPWLMNPDGTGQVQQTQLPATLSNTIWSFNAAKLAYLAAVSSQGSFSTQYDLFTINTDGTGGPQQITFTDVAHEAPLAWAAPPPGPLAPEAAGGRILFARSASSPSSTSLWTVNADGSAPLQITPSVTNVHDTQGDFSPDGQKVVFSRQAGNAFDQRGIWIMGADGSAPTQIAPGDFNSAVFSPDGLRIAATNGQGLVVMDTQGGSRVTIPMSSASPGTLSWQPGVAAPSLDVQIGQVQSTSPQETFQLTVTLANTSSTEDLEAITLDYPHGFGVASDYYPAGQRGEIQVVSGPDPPFPATLAAKQSSVHTITLRAAHVGKVGLKAKVKARGVQSHQDVEDTHYGEVEVAEIQPLAAERTAMVASGVALYLDRATRALREQQARYARALFDALKSRLSAKARKFYFGSKTELKITPLERALARWRNASPDLTALVTPNKHKLYEKGFAYLNEEQFARYQELQQAEMLQQAEKYLGKKAAALGVELRYWGGVLTEEGRGQLAADIAQWRELNARDGEYLLAALGNIASGSAGAQAIDEADVALKKGFEKIVNGLLQARDARIGNLVKLAENNPDGFISQIAKDDGKLGFEGWQLLAEQLFGEIQDRLQGKLLSGASAAFARFANATGLTNLKKAKALARETLIGERSATLGPSFMDDLSEDAKSMIDLRKMEEIGGMPADDVEITKGIVAQANARLKQLGYDIEAEALFRPANPFKVKGAFAKVETVGVKNIAPIDLALGAPPSLLAETAIFKPTDPTKLAGWKNYPEVEKVLLRERYAQRLDEYNQFHGHAPVTDKKMKEMLKAFDKTHTFDQIGQGRTIKMKLTTDKVEGATVLKYDYLEVEGKVLIKAKDKPRSIGTDYDGAVIVDKNTRQPLKGQALTAVEGEMRRLGEKAAIEKGYANPFHGFTAHGSDVAAAEYPSVAHFWLRHLKEADAIREAQRLADSYNLGKLAGQQITAAALLSKVGGLFERHLLRVSASDASFGPANVVFRTPVVAPR